MNLGEDMPLDLTLTGASITGCRITDETYVDAPRDLPCSLKKNTMLYIETK